MIISANGLVFNEYGDTLLVQRDDTRTPAPPGGAVEIGELPPRTAEREVQEETGLEVRAVRLVGLYHLPFKPTDYLFLCFRAIQRGGKLSSSAETPQAGFVPSYPLPESMLAFHREQVQRGLAHPGGAPYWGTHTVDRTMSVGMTLLNRVVYPWLGLRRRLRVEPAFEPPPDWQVHGTAILRNDVGEVYWLPGPMADTWVLPTAVGRASEPPWAAAARAAAEAGFGGTSFTALRGVYPAAGQAQMTFVFGGEATGKATAFAAVRPFAAGAEPPGADPLHLTLVRDSAGPDVNFRLLEED